MPSYCRSYPGVYKGAKHFEEIPNCDLKLLGAIACRYTWAPAIFKDNYRSRANFESSRFTAFDIDNTDGDLYTLDQAINDWCDTACIIATTRSHQLPKGNFPAADRFRIIVQWETPITSRTNYEYNMRQLIKTYPQFDQACVDAARLFYPCTKIVHANFDGYLQPVQNQEEKALKSAIHQIMKANSNRIPRHVDDFIKKGIIFGHGRNVSVYVSVLELLNVGTPAQKVLELLKQSPFDRAEFSDHELENTFYSAVKRYVET